MVVAHLRSNLALIASFGNFFILHMSVKFLRQQRKLDKSILKNKSFKAFEFYSLTHSIFLTHYLQFRLIHQPYIDELLSI
jgi:hypothetical protein